MKKNIVWILFGIIIIVAGCIRLYKIDQVPASPDWDEAALGYNAYSILQTGRDEYGKVFPVVLQSFDDYKPALYAYLVIPFIKLFDVSVLAVRLPSAIVGIFAVAAVFFLVRELFQKNVHLGKVEVKRNTLSLLTMLLVAISPWHIQFSRVGFEAQVGLAFNIFATLFFLKGLRNKYFLPVSFFFAAVNIYVYQSEKVYTPLLFIVLFVVFWRQFIKIPKKWIIGSFTLAVLVVLPMAIFILTNPNALARAKGVSVFSDTEKLLSANSEKINRDHASGDYLGLILDNRRIEYGKAFASGYLSHFTPNWLFYEGDVARHHAPFMGQLYIWTLPFILIGLYVLLFSAIDRKTKWFVLLFMFIAPIPASVTIDVPHAVRTINFIPVFDVLTALGALYVLGWIWSVKYSFLKLKIKYVVVGVAGVMIVLNILYYFNQYFVQLNYFDSKYWQYGWKDAVAYTVKEGKKFDHIVVTNQPPLDQSYVFFLFYTKYDPKKYQESGGTKSGGFNDQHTAFDKYVFRPINWDKDKLSKNTLFVGSPKELPVNFAYTFHYLNGEPAIVVSRRFE